MTMEKTFNAREAEQRIYKAWEESGAFLAGANAREGAESFCIMIPPPNVTGSLHMGHAFNNTLQDILVRWHRMRGHDTLWQPGQDHAGIATQMVVERMLAEQGLGRRDLGREKFLERIWEWKAQSGDTIIGQLKRLGASCDWSRNRFTMDEGFQKAVLRVFVDLYNKGLIHRGKRLVNWDPKFETAISDLEVENIEVDGHMWHFRYPLAGGETYTHVERDADGNVILEEERNWISIATTRPETMLGDGAVAVHPSDERYAPIVGKLVEIPVGPKEHRRLIPIITDEYPDPAFGSGAVKITGAHDFNDYAVARRAGIPLYRLMDTRAHMRSDGLPYAQGARLATEIAEGRLDPSEVDIDQINLVPEHLRGLDRYEARERVIREITEEGLAVMVPDEEGNLTPLVEHKKIMQPFGDRSKVVIEPMLTDQWFVDTARIVGPAIEAVRSGEIRIMPEQQEKVYFHWLENIEPWCISRQLWWGHQIPVWYDDEGNEYCAPSEEEARRMAGGRALTRDPDVLDTWFSSGLWPIGTLGWPEDTPELAKYFPTDVLITGFDILFFWVARMIMMQYAVVGEKPFHTVYTHALVRDEKGKKMSKSLGNVIDPLEVIDEYGADAVRFTLAALAAMGRDVKLSTSRIAGYRNFGTKIWNAVRFAEMNGVYADGAPPAAPPAARASANRWIIGETARARAATDAALQAFRFNDAANGLYAFAWGRVCDWYVEFAKPLLASNDAEVVAETRATMGWVLDQVLKLLHPFMPFITEELWQVTACRERMLIHADWPEYTPEELVDESAEAEMRWVIALIEEVRSARAEMNVPAGLKAALVVQGITPEARAAWQKNEALIRRLARIESLDEVASAPRSAVSLAVEGGVFSMPLEGLIDIAAERARLEKARARLEKELRGLRGRLDNPRFTENAPEEVVAETRANMSAREAEAARIEAALGRLAEMG